MVLNTQIDCTLSPLCIYTRTQKTRADPVANLIFRGGFQAFVLTSMNSSYEAFAKIAVQMDCFKSPYAHVYA